LPSHDLELVIGLALFPLVILSHGGSPLKGIRNPNSIVGREPLLLVLKFQLNAGASSIEMPTVAAFDNLLYGPSGDQGAGTLKVNDFQ
jgi:hypothetical protein